MEKYSGKTVYHGIAVGEIRVYKKDEREIVNRRGGEAEEEIRRFREALDKADSQLAALCQRAAEEAGEDSAAIFEIHRMMLEDPDYIESVEANIRRQGVNAEYAVKLTGDEFALRFSSMSDEYMRGRAADVLDISSRLRCVLSGGGENSRAFDKPVIIAARDLAPSETVQLDKRKILAFITSRGSVNSHTAILARTMNIPAVVGTDMEITDELNGKTAVVDGYSGEVYIDPDGEVLSRAMEQRARDAENRELLLKLRGRENATVDGKKIQLYANIGNLKDIDAVLENDAGGIGLFRSEFIYLEREDYPTEEEQFRIYKAAAEKMGGRKVIIRTLDIGADKQADYFGLAKEENPAMGLRAVRICLSRPEIFKTQLRAIFRAAAYGRIAVMYPMITSVDEVIEIRKIAEDVKAELRASSAPFGDTEQGIMIETPAAAVISDLLAPHVDFFSLGTNDLSQYTMAIDRQNPLLDRFFNPLHPAVLRMIKTTVDNAHRCGKWAGICGEIGGDTSLTEFFLSIGVDELSVSPSRILPVRKKIIETDVEKIKDYALRLLK